MSGESAERGRLPAPTDDEYEAQRRQVAIAKERADLARMQEERGLRRRIANGALCVMLLQILVANAIFAWYGDTNGWDVSPAAISAWLAATVVQVVLVITNYLFPKPPSTP